VNCGSWASASWDDVGRLSGQLIGVLRYPGYHNPDRTFCAITNGINNIGSDRGVGERSECSSVLLWALNFLI
jgi:hypothetical protein